MTRQNDIFTKEDLPQTTKDEPKIENDYTNHTEINQPNPSTATPSIPTEMPMR
ncbi:MAG: hypothetical protein K0S04_2609 [Herbinix sp.]|jgi:hypothetical protein|nr:hypothetical protein [Herbinix sp.]